MTLQEIKERYKNIPFTESAFYCLKVDLSHYFQKYSGFFRFEEPTKTINGRMYFYSRSIFEKLSNVLYAWFIVEEVPSGTYNVLVNGNELTEFVVKWEHKYGLESSLTIENQLTGSVLDVTYSAVGS